MPSYSILLVLLLLTPFIEMVTFVTHPRSWTLAGEERV